MMDTNIIMGGAALVFIVFDLVSGLVKGFAEKNLSSTKMRSGLFHKLGFVLALLLSYFAQWLCLVFQMPDGFAAVYPAVCLWVVLTEGVSVFENLCAISPELAMSPLGSLFKVSDSALFGDGDEDA